MSSSFSQTAPSLISAAAYRALWFHFEAGQGPKLAALLCRLARHGHCRLLDSYGEHVLADEWRDFAWTSLQEYFAHRKGFAYVVTNPVNAGLLKMNYST